MVQIFDKYGVLKRPAILGVASWGSIIGTVTSQTDLITYLGTNYVPQVRELTINGVTYDLSADRSWTISGATWGSITGTITDQTDLITYLSSNYFPIPTGTTAQYIRGDGSLATFPTIPTVTPSPLTKTDDTNVILTLTGTPASALLQAVNIAVGWTGTLDITRGGTGLNTLGTANQLIRVNAGATALEYFTPSFLTTAITSLNGLTGTSQTFVNDTNITIVSAGTTHTLTWVGTLADARIASSGTWNAKIGGSGTVNELAYFTASGTIASLSTGTYPNLTELSYIKGLLSNAQTQFNNRTKTVIANLTASAAHTGTVLETQIGSFDFQIPANTYNAVDMLRIKDIAFNKTGTANTITIRIKINSTNTFATATTIATFQAMAANTYGRGQRTFKIEGGNIKGLLFTNGNVFNDYITAAIVYSTTAFSVSSIVYGFVSIQLNTATDSVILDSLVITN
jgi:hypothetical protein